jgi:hypothetical protein
MFRNNPFRKENKMDTFDKSNINLIRDAIQTALDNVAKDLRDGNANISLDLKLGGISYSDTNFKATLSCAVIDDNGVVQNKERAAYIELSELYDLDPAWIDQTFMDYEGRTMKITGLNTRARKQPILLEDKEGNTYKGPVAMVRDHMTNRSMSV